MKIMFRLTAAFALLLLVGCSNEENDLTTDQLIEVDLASDAYQNSNVGIYNGVFTTNDGQQRGSIAVTIPADEITKPSATLEFASGEIVTIESNQTVTSQSKIVDLPFSLNGTSLYFSVEGNGTTPKITNVVLNNAEGSMLIKKHTTRAPVVPIPGTYICDDCGTHPVLNNTTTQTFNMLMFTAPDGDSSFETEVTLGMNVFDGTGSQSNCVADGTETTCDLSGSFMANGAPITWSGTHTFNNEAMGANDCSGASGTWAFVSNNFGTLSGTFESDEDCVEDFILYSEGFDTFTGAGFAPTPAAGQLDSDIIIANGFSGSLAYGGTQSSGDYARGSDENGGVSTGGIYSFDVDASGESTLGVQPGGSDFTPGYFEFRIENTSGVDLNNFTIAYDLWVNNDQSRGNSLNFSYSTDGTSFTNVASLNFTSDIDSNEDGFTKTEQTGTFTTSVTDGSFIYFRFEGDDNGGSGSRDEFAVDNILLTGN